MRSILPFDIRLHCGLIYNVAGLQSAVVIGGHRNYIYRSRSSRLCLDHVGYLCAEGVEKYDGRYVRPFLSASTIHLSWTL
jgi:hypothetical protein